MITTQGFPTIAAIATAKGQGGIAVIRISGSRAWEIATEIFISGKTKKAPSLKAGRVFHGWVIKNEITKNNLGDSTDNILDEVILLAFKGPRSFTGEDVIEIQGHGGDYLAHLILERCIQAGAVLAQPGEFTKRAFLNGKLDLTQAESVMDLVSANNEKLLNIASSNLKNRSLGKSLDNIREQMIQLQTQLIAHTDFPDEVDAPEKQLTQNLLRSTMGVLSHLAQAADKNKIIREGYQVAILGLPNSGKSSLFNTLLANERAIVTEIAGTTRDVITETLIIEGVEVTLLDTAGIRETENTVEKIGIERSWQAASQAQAILYVYDRNIGLVQEDQEHLEQLDAQKLPVLILANKSDIAISDPTAQSLPKEHISISAKTSTGINTIFEWLAGKIQHHVIQEENQSVVSLNQRQRQCLQNILQHLNLVRETLENEHLPLDLATVPLSDALYEFDKLSGRDTTEEVLDEVFSQFCVGK